MIKSEGQNVWTKTSARTTALLETTRTKKVIESPPNVKACVVWHTAQLRRYLGPEARWRRRWRRRAAIQTVKCSCAVRHADSRNYMHERKLRAGLLAELRSLRYDMVQNLFDDDDLKVPCELRLGAPRIINTHGHPCSTLYLDHQQQMEDVLGLTAYLVQLVQVYSSSTPARAGDASCIKRVQSANQEEGNHELVPASQEIAERPSSQPLASTQQPQHSVLLNLPKDVFDSVLDRVNPGVICSVLRTSCMQMRNPTRAPPLKRRPSALVLLVVNHPSNPSHFASHPSPVTCHTESDGQLICVIFTQSCSAVHLSLPLSLPPLHKLQHLVCG